MLVGNMECIIRDDVQSSDMVTALQKTSLNSNSGMLSTEGDAEQW